VLLLDVWKRFRSANMRDISRFFVSENCVAMTTRHKLIRKKAPICRHDNATPTNAFIGRCNVM